ncbi:family 2 encapsulin nanocompartment cargo protein terpene cyclase [Nocardia anaemiae]|uniref:family 2 encapsulin nanocompartment cargo protein terpene cyclase n=1 Tax=Nocardia anaemiae TaxID=263910 RepID=UPI000A020E54|nr:family 2 encapsulin nanocompartment cargo protein terpene cyclase [Nocardia anaemiae]
MSVLSRASAPPATHEVAAAVAALLSNLDTTAPPTLPLEVPAPETSASPENTEIPESTETPECTATPESSETQAVEADSPELDRPTQPETIVPRSLLGPSGLGAAALLLPTSTTTQAGLPTTEVPDPARTPTIRAAGLQPPPIAFHAPSTAVGVAQGAAPTATEPESPRSRIPLGPTGLGTASAYLHGTAAPIPPLYCPPPLRDDPALAELVNDGLIDWARDIGLYAGRLDELRDADFGQLIMLAHPDSDDPDRLLAAAKCAVSEWSVDDYYCEEGADETAPDGTPSSAEAELGPRLELAAAAMDPVHLPARYQAQLERALQADPILRAFRTSFEHLSRYATPAQLARLRTEIAGWFIALGAEAGWRAAHRMPPVWEYLTNRQPHSFLPCMAPIDVVGGYELQAAEYTDPRVRRVVTTAALASQMVNDLYSMAREDVSDGREFNLPTVLAAEEHCSRREAVLRTAIVHDELVHRFEQEAGPLAAAGSAELRRFLGGLWAWMGGNRAWHAASKRYNESN